MELAIDLEKDIVVAGQDLWGSIVVRGAAVGEELEVQLSAKGMEYVDVRAEDLYYENVFLSTVVLQEKVRPDAAGEATLPFTTCFPESSCCNSFSYQHRLGYDAGVRYSLTYTVQRVRAKGAAEAEEEPPLKDSRSVTVLEAHGKSSHPIVVKETKNNMWKKGFLEASMVVEKNAHCKGSSIPIRIVVDNKSGKVVTGITLTLRRRLLFQVPGKFRKEQVTEAYSTKHEVNIPTDSSAAEPQSVDLTFPLHNTLDSTVNGQWVNLQYKIGAAISYGGPLTGDLTVQSPIVILSPEVALNDDGNGQHIQTSEFCFPANAGQANEQGEMPLLTAGKTVKGAVFYRTNQFFFIDIANSPDFADLSVVLRISANADIGVHGKYGSPPTVLSWDISEVPVGDGKWTLTLNRYSVPRLSPGRWYFAVLGKALLQTSDYAIKFDAESVKANRHSDFGDRVEETVYENQRRMTPFTAFGRDPSCPLWSTLGGVACPAKEDMPLPDSNWYWESPWQAEMEGADAEGWQYSRTWTAGWRSDANATCFVRRRTWKRTRKLKTKEIRQIEEASKEDVALELEDLVDEFESLEVPYIDDESVDSAVLSAIAEAESAPVDSMDATGVDVEHLDEASLSEDECDSLAAELSRAACLSEGTGKENKQTEAADGQTTSIHEEPYPPRKDVASDDLVSLATGAAEPKEAFKDSCCEEDVKEDVGEDTEGKVEEGEVAIDVATDTYRLELHRIQQEAETRAADMARREAEDEKRRKEAEEEFERRESERVKKLEEAKRAREREQELVQEAWKAREDEMRRQLEADQRRLQSLLGVEVACEEVVDDAAAEPVQADRVAPSPAAPTIVTETEANEDDDELDSMFEACSDDEFSDDDV